MREKKKDKERNVAAEMMVQIIFFLKQFPLILPHCINKMSVSLPAIKECHADESSPQVRTPRVPPPLTAPKINVEQISKL